MDFTECKLSKELIQGLEKQRILKPTKVQETVIEKMMNNQDLIVESETGSGKTLAYLLPIYQKIQPIEKGMKVLVLVPTHELAMQVHRQVERLSKNSGIPVGSTPIVGNVNINRQIEYLREKPQIVIGTTGRILELIKKKKISAHTIKTIVIDEADKLIDANNIEGTKAVIKCCMKDTQIVMFSASIPKKTVEIGMQMLKNPEIVKTASETVIPKNIKHMYLLVERRDKIEVLRKLASSLNPKKAIVFINKLSEIEEATQKLQYHKYNAECIHGSNIKEDRKKVIQDFTSGKLQFLIATDIAARGLHIDGVTTVIHISIPEDPMDYLHRAGRCGRGEEEGLSISVITKEELPLIKSYQKAFGINMIPRKLYQGKLVRE